MKTRYGQDMLDGFRETENRVRILKMRQDDADTREFRARERQRSRSRRVARYVKENSNL
jgi:hypothetical protein